MKRIMAFWMTLLLCIGLWSLPVSAKQASGGPQISAKAAVLMDAATGDVLFSQKPHEKLYPASVTKVMSLLLFMEALENKTLSLEDPVTTSPDAAQKGGSQIWLKEGETMTVDELLRATVIGSANDACCALAEQVAGSEQAFVSKMNERAKQLGMKDTTFVNCTGLDDDTSEHLTSAYDIAVMSRELLQHECIRTYTTVWMDSLRDGQTELVNTNRLVRFYPGATGLKTGTTAKAGCCISASAERDGLHLIAVVLGAQNSNDRFNGAKAMLDWGFASFETVQLTVDETLLTDITVLGGIKDRVTPIPKALPTVTVKKGTKDKIEPNISLPVDIAAPVEPGQILGTVDFTVDGNSVATGELAAAEGIPKLKYIDVLQRLLSALTLRWFSFEK